MTKQELIDATRKAIELDNVKFNIISGDKHVHSWGVEVIINNVVIILNSVMREDADPDASIRLAYKSDKCLNNGDVFNIPVKNETIEYSLYEELVNKINKKLLRLLRTEDDVAQELKSLFREDLITNILEEG